MLRARGPWSQRGPLGRLLRRRLQPRCRSRLEQQGAPGGWTWASPAPRGSDPTATPGGGAVLHQWLLSPVGRPPCRRGHCELRCCPRTRSCTRQAQPRAGTGVQAGATPPGQRRHSAGSPRAAPAPHALRVSARPASVDRTQKFWKPDNAKRCGLLKKWSVCFAFWQCCAKRPAGLGTRRC